MPGSAAADFSFLSLFLQAHIVVKLVMIGLLIASVWGWGIIIEKNVRCSRRARGARPTSSSGCSGPASRWRSFTAWSRSSRPSAMAALFIAAMREWRRSIEGILRPLARRAASHREGHGRDHRREMDRLERRLLFLATVGSTAPFIGLFGTVWGIMTSFQSIAVSKNTSLAVVAPGIAEALFATALGLLAAIPAVIFYNKFSAEAGRLVSASRRLCRRVRGDRVAPDRHEDLRSHGRQRSTAANGPAKRRGRRQRRAPMSEINVTPFVDVMLVLLIIFMVTAPMLTVGVPIDLPKTEANAVNDSSQKEPLTVTVGGGW